MTQCSSPSRPMSLDDSLSLMMPTSNNLMMMPRRPSTSESPQEQRDFLIGILDEVLDILNEDIFEEDNNNIDSKSNRRGSQQ
eukprot:CAMPEP_0113632002 /NCGR_PEP_ID=MMETSP0017_2-20120614/16632_1 /TAXON_ID=2856 /ORGANISM="Cylindrotheca closterium" /LENGTH=81 /DNA_ID=CAMNT_0000542537 /DNA_START=146 /DNA_END=391 /DNA_ORIENTATION=+ /assembly_acc=CAM_ASM_000147